MVVKPVRISQSFYIPLFHKLQFPTVIFSVETTRLQALLAGPVHKLSWRITAQGSRYDEGNLTNYGRPLNY